MESGEVLKENSGGIQREMTVEALKEFLQVLKESEGIPKEFPRSFFGEVFDGIAEDIQISIFEQVTLGYSQGNLEKNKLEKKLWRSP